ncbi:hypothetical protein [Undibacterium baiyunense]|nr:hypothetical protein [Undibacterium baiyunense]
MSFSMVFTSCYLIICRAGATRAVFLHFVLAFAFADRSLVGGSPTASYLFCFAKKGNPKKATTLPLPFGFPIMQDKKWESFETRFAQTTKLSLSIFCLAQLAVSEVDEDQNQKLSQNQQQHQNNQDRTSFIFLIAVVGRCI